MRRWGALIAVVAFAAGCAGDAAPGTEATGGTEGTEGPGWEHAGWALEEDLRLDADAEDFSLVRSVRVGSHGWMAVGLPQDAQVRIYDPEGRLAWAVGRRGEGPGEFQHIGPLTWLGDTLVVDDATLRRHTFVDLDGQVLRTRTLPSPLSQASAASRDGGDSITFQFFMAISAAPADEVLGIASPMVPPRGPNRVPVPRVLVSLGAHGNARLLPTPPDIHDDRWMITLAGRSNPVPFALRPRVVVSSNGQRLAFVTADQSRREGDFQMTALEIDGDTTFHGRYPFTGEAITPMEVDSAVAAMTPIDRFREEARSRIPEVHAPVDGVVLALDGTVWVTLRGGREALVLDREGAPLALVPLPARSRVQDATGAHVYMTEADALGLISVVRYRIAGRN